MDSKSDTIVTEWIMRTEEGGDATRWWESSIQLGFRLMKGRAPRRSTHRSQERCVSTLCTTSLVTL